MRGFEIFFISVWAAILGGLTIYILNTERAHRRRDQLILVSYWILFLILPLAAVAWYLRFEKTAFFIAGPLFLALVLAGEKGVKAWGHLWNVSHDHHLLHAHAPLAAFRHSFENSHPHLDILSFTVSRGPGPARFFRVRYRRRSDDQVCEEVWRFGPSHDEKWTVCQPSKDRPSALRFRRNKAEDANS
ncbi:MAG: hypothetical protein JO317_01390 [Verrucomicrobiae bacterium]|nr:hypothetical protein [Verrucomicrobiae bacterium]